MHIPNTLYERAPHYWLFIGVLLIVLGVYLGVQVDSAYLALGLALGIGSCLWGIRVFVYRARKPGEANVAASNSSAE